MRPEALSSLLLTISLKDAQYSPSPTVLVSPGFVVGRHGVTVAQHVSLDMASFAQHLCCKLHPCCGDSGYILVVELTGTGDSASDPGQATSPLWHNPLSIQWGPG